MDMRSDTRSYDIKGERFAHDLDDHRENTVSSSRAAARNTSAIAADAWRVSYHEAAIRQATDVAADPYRGELIF